jgi:hypothetical protein
MYFGYCSRSGGYRMMDLPDFLSSMQDGVSRLMADSSSAFRDAVDRLYGRSGGGRDQWREDCRGHGEKRDRACHCECCVCDADVLVHARCGEVRRIPVTFENDTRRERPVTIALEPFATAGGRQLGWPAKPSEVAFTLGPCDEHTVVVSVQVRCEPGAGTGEPDRPAGRPTDAADERVGSVDRCQVGYATLRAEGCLLRPVLIAVAVLPDDCDAYHRPCQCRCCH